MCDDRCRRAMGRRTAYRTSQGVVRACAAPCSSPGALRKERYSGLESSPLAGSWGASTATSGSSAPESHTEDRTADHVPSTSCTRSFLHSTLVQTPSRFPRRSSSLIVWLASHIPASADAPTATYCTRSMDLYRTFAPLDFAHFAARSFALVDTVASTLAPSLCRRSSCFALASHSIGFWAVSCYPIQLERRSTSESSWSDHTTTLPRRPTDVQRPPHFYLQQLHLSHSFAVLVRS